jgi:hypothetical protein
LSHSTTYIEQFRCQDWLISSALSEMLIRQHNNICVCISFPCVSWGYSNANCVNILSRLRNNCHK